MMEPRHSIHCLRKDSSLIRPGTSEVEILMEHEEPERPVSQLLEYEVVPIEGECPQPAQQEPSSDVKLYLSFIALVITGSANVVTAKLQAIPMFNYPNFLNLFTNLMYIPICFAYIIPVARYGWFNNAITREQLEMPKRPFMIMGALDCLASSMQIFASVYLPGSLLVLLPQAAIPISMILSRYLLHERYRCLQYLGAIVVLLGIGVVLEPVISHRHSPDYYCEAINVNEDCTVCQTEATEDGCLAHQFFSDDAIGVLSNHTNPQALCEWRSFEDAKRREEMLIFLWSFIMIASCIPMTLSTIYKQIALVDGTELDPIYLNGWIAIYQFLFALVVAVPAGVFASPSIKPIEVPGNIWDGALCYIGIGTVEKGCHPDTMCSFHAALYVNMFLVANTLYSFFMMYVLKYGSSALLFLALTAIVPIGNLAFSLPFMPQATTPKDSDIAGLVVILLGLVLYRFANHSKSCLSCDDGEGGNIHESTDDALDPNPMDRECTAAQLSEPLLSGDV